MAYRCAILDDYQNVALKLADWSPVAKDVDITVFNQPLGGQDEVIKALADFDIVCGMRERTPFPRAVIEALPKLKLLITTGARNASFDLEAAKERKVTVCGTPGVGNPTAGIALGLDGHTLGVIGLGKLGTRVAQIAKAFGMKVIAWSQNLTPEKCQEAGVQYAGKEDLLRQADFISIHVVLSPRTRGLLGAKELSLMKPTGYLINTSRGPIIDEAALLAALKEGRIAGAGLDVFDTEPLPVDHPLRRLDNVVLTPHLGYVSVQNYRAYFAGVVEDIRGFLDGKPVRAMT